MVNKNIKNSALKPIVEPLLELTDKTLIRNI